MTGQREIDGALDCVGAEETIRTGFGLLATAGAFTSVGLLGNRIDIPLFPLVAREYTYYGSFLGKLHFVIRPLLISVGANTMASERDVQDKTGRRLRQASTSCWAEGGP